MAVLIMLVAFVGGACGDAAPHASIPTHARAATTTTLPVSTTTAYPAPGPNQTVVATALVPNVQVVADLPPDAPATGTPMVDRTTFAPASTGSRAGAPLPNPNLSVGGRAKTPIGWAIQSPTTFGDPAVFVVTEERGPWLRVQIPVRPDGAEGWIRASDVALSTIDTRVVITVGTRTLQAYAGDQLLAQTKVVVGAPNTPTPTGRFFVTDYTARAPTGSYGPWVLPLSAFSQVMDRFSDGVPVIAMHGTNHPEYVGQNRSNGCVRMPNGVIQTLRDDLPLGTPVDIRP
jgi:lipoprotein-anchoring transpeptidase ErfK/SrfK